MPKNQQKRHIFTGIEKYKISAGQLILKSTLFFQADNKLYAIGNNSAFQLGIGSNKALVETPAEVLLPEKKIIKKIIQGAGRDVTFFLDTEGKIYICGTTSKRQVFKKPTIRGNRHEIKDIACTKDYFIFLTKEGKLFCSKKFNWKFSYEGGPIKYIYSNCNSEIVFLVDDDNHLYTNTLFKRKFKKIDTLSGFSVENAICACFVRQATYLFIFKDKTLFIIRKTNETLGLIKKEVKFKKTIKEIACSSTYLLVLFEDGTIKLCTGFSRFAKRLEIKRAYGYKATEIAACSHFFCYLTSNGNIYRREIGQDKSTPIIVNSRTQEVDFQ